MIETLPDFEKTQGRPYRGIVVTDFDGTLRTRTKDVTERDLDCLRNLETAGYLRVIATGRSLHSLFKTIDYTFPVDYVLFSSGAGVLDFRSRKIIRGASIDLKEAEAAVDLLLEMKLDFMIHDPIPDNHKFRFHRNRRDNRDFEERLDIYRDWAKPLIGSGLNGGAAAQLVAVIPSAETSIIYNRIEKALPDLTVIRTTSPLNGTDTWIEIFPEGVSKGLSTRWLAGLFSLDASDTIAIGNDYNDQDLLEWAGRSCVVSSAPEELKRMFHPLASGTEGGLAEAAELYLGSLTPEERENNDG